MFNRKRHSNKSLGKLPRLSLLILIITTLTIFVLIFVVRSVPIETVRVGECGVRSPIRVSLLFDGREEIDQAKIEAERRYQQKQEVLRANPGLALGCSPGPVYKLYLL